MPRGSEPIGVPQTGGAAERGQVTAEPRRRPGLRLVGLALRVAVRVMAILVIVAGAVVGLFAWRLSQGPVDADFLRPTLEATLSQIERGLTIKLGGAQIAYDAAAHAIDLTGRDVKLIGDEGQVLVSVPEIALGLSLRAAFKGVVAPTRIVVREPHFRLRREEDGAWTFGVATGGDGGVIDERLVELLEPPADDSSLGQLREIALRGASVEVDDRMVGLTWSARRGAATLFRTPRGFKGDATF